MAQFTEAKLSLEEQFKFQAIRLEVQQAKSIEELRSVALQAIDLMEQQKRVVLGMLQQGYLGLPPVEVDRLPH